MHIVYGVGPDTLSTATIRSCGDSYITFALRPAFNTHLRDLSTIAGDASCPTLELSLGTSDQELNSPTPGFNCDAEFSKGAFDNIDYCGKFCRKSDLMILEGCAIQDIWLKRILNPNLVKSSFLHNRPWIWLWVKSISNDLYITIQTIASQLSGHCDVISNRLWCHQQNENRVSETLGRFVRIVVFIAMYGFVMSRKK